MWVVKLSFLEDQNAFLNVVGIVVHRIWMLNYDAAPSTYSHVAFRFDPHYAITISKPGIQYEPRDVSNDGILLSLHEHIIRYKPGHSARGQDPVEVTGQIINQSKKPVIVFQQ